MLDFCYIFEWKPLSHSTLYSHIKMVHVATLIYLEMPPRRKTDYFMWNFFARAVALIKQENNESSLNVRVCLGKQSNGEVNQYNFPGMIIELLFIILSHL